MKLENEKSFEVVEYDLNDLSKQEHIFLREIGLKEIVKDDLTLINYGVNFILQQWVTDLEKNVGTLKEQLKVKKNKKNSKKS